MLHRMKLGTALRWYLGWSPDYRREAYAVWSEWFDNTSERREILRNLRDDGVLVEISCLYQVAVAVTVIELFREVLPFGDWLKFAESLGEDWS